MTGLRSTGGTGARAAGLRVFMMSLMIVGVSALGANAEIRWHSAPQKNLQHVTAADSGAALRTLVGQADRHVVVQFAEPVTTQQREQLAAAGVTLNAYLGDNAFFALVQPARLDEARIAAAAPIAGASAIDRNVKLHREFVNHNVREFAVGRRPLAEQPGEDVDWVAAYAVFHPGVELNVAAAKVNELDGVVVDFLESINGLVIEIPMASINALADADETQWIEPALPQFSTTNDSNRERTRANDMQEAPYNLDGTGVTVMVYDGGTAAAGHPDFGGRLTTHDGAGLSGHATHVCGTVGGNGNNAFGTYRGMAPNVTIRSYGFQYDGSDIFLYSNPGDIETDYNQAINSFGAAIANNSIGTNVEINGFDCNITGDYGVCSSVIDAIVRGSQGDVIRVVWANGNERQGSRCGSSYNTTAPPAGAKNHLSIGAMNANDNSVTSFTSWGPVDDGRLKPDISAPGCQSNGDGSVTSLDTGSGYTTACGTSMSAPTVSGLAALLLQDFRAHNPTLPDYLPSTQKVIFVNTADDIQNTGPDYQSGYGVIRVDRAIELMRAGSFLEDSVSQGGSVIVNLNVPAGTPELRVTLAWDDPPGTPNVNPALVNDLDLIVRDPGATQHFPWTLNPGSPATPAVKTTADHLNNLEQVHVANPAAGTWTIEISGFSVPQGPQTFSIAATPSLPNTSIAVVNPIDLVSPSSPTTVTAAIEVTGESLLSQTLHYSVDAGPVQNVAMSSVGGGLYEGDIPAIACGSTVTYHVSATTSVTGTITDPFDAPASTYSALTGTQNVIFSDDFESNMGWSAGVGGDSASTGIWTRVTPIGTGPQPIFDKTADPGTMCFVTGQGSANGSLGENDVDGGVTTLMSPLFDASGNPEATVSYWRLYSNTSGADPFNDTAVIQISNNNGGAWTTVETLGPADSDASGGWIFHSFRIADFVAPTNQMRFRFQASDLGSGSIIEAALDDFNVSELVCMGGCPDADGDGVCDPNDICPGGDDNVDNDGDGVPDFCDICPGFNDNLDGDGDGVPNGCDVCNGNDASGDTDGDGVCDDIDPCPIDNPDDSDGDGVCDSADICPGFDDNVDADGDGVPNGCDVCNGNDASGDTDGDGVCDDIDPCPLDNPDDSDGDGVCDSADICPGFDDNVDADGDGVPNGCDVCNGNDASGDTDGDGVCDDIDPCPLDNPDDSDGDGVCDSADICPGGDDNMDTDMDGIPDFCDPVCNLTNGDFDCDGDVDLADFATFSLCFGGANVPPAASCPPGIDADFDNDGDVDLGDFSAFSLNFTGPL